jgi:hypothetical protein
LFGIHNDEPAPIWKGAGKRNGPGHLTIESPMIFSANQTALGLIAAEAAALTPTPRN